jgi:hypothetical protein
LREKPGVCDGLVAALPKLIDGAEHVFEYAKDAGGDGLREDR